MCNLVVGIDCQVIVVYGFEQYIFIKNLKNIYEV